MNPLPSRLRERTNQSITASISCSWCCNSQRSTELLRHSCCLPPSSWKSCHSPPARGVYVAHGAVNSGVPVLAAGTVSTSMLVEIQGQQRQLLRFGCGRTTSKVFTVS